MDEALHAELMALPDYPGIYAKVVMISPEQARRYLERNTSNRKISAIGLKTIQHIMDTDQWFVTNDALCFDEDGKLSNAQHRLMKIAAGLKSYPMLLAWNLDRDAQNHMDNGIRRTAAGQLQILGETSSNQKAAICKRMLQYDPINGPMSTGTVSVTSGEIVEMAVVDEMVSTALHYQRQLGEALKNANVATVGAAYYILLNSWPNKVEEFHEKLSQGIMLSAGSPILQLRNNILGNRFSQKTFWDQKWSLAMILKTFNLWIEDQPRQVLRFVAGDNWPIPYTEESYAKLLESKAKAAKGYETRRQREAAGYYDKPDDKPEFPDA